MNFATLQGLTIPEGAVTQIADASGRVLWKVSGGKAILEVEKITSDTYAGETTYTGEQFILLDIYPKTNGTVKVTYGGLTKTITDTSGEEEPNAQQVFFGTFNGVPDSVTTPASGELTIEGDCRTFACGQYSKTKAGLCICTCITAVESFGEITEVADFAFGGIISGGTFACTKITSLKLPNSILTIGAAAFRGCTGLTNINIPSSVKSILANAFAECSGLTSVSFEDTSGWYVTENEDDTSGTAVDVSNAAGNAALISNEYCAYYWYNS